LGFDKSKLGAKTIFREKDNGNKIVNASENKTQRMTIDKAERLEAEGPERMRRSEKTTGHLQTLEENSQSNTMTFNKSILF
jgi:hypothetical protein